MDSGLIPNSPGSGRGQDETVFDSGALLVPAKSPGAILQELMAGCPAPLVVNDVPATIDGMEILVNARAWQATFTMADRIKKHSIRLGSSTFGSSSSSSSSSSSCSSSSSSSSSSSIRKKLDKWQLYRLDAMLHLKKFSEVLTEVQALVESLGHGTSSSSSSQGQGQGQGQGQDDEDKEKERDMEESVDAIRLQLYLVEANSSVGHHALALQTMFTLFNKVMKVTPSSSQAQGQGERQEQAQAQGQ